MELTVLPGLDSDGGADPSVAARVARAWRSGGLVGLPTETVYGLSADAQQGDAVARIYQAKGRPADHPLIVHVASSRAIGGWAEGPTPVATALAQTFWPGPLTVVVPRSPRAGDFVTGGQPTVALRCPAHPVALAAIRAFAELTGDPARGVAAPSANRFGQVSPTRAHDVVAELGRWLDPDTDLVVDGGTCAVGVESTIVDCTTSPPRILRLGAIGQEQIDAVVSALDPASTSTGSSEPPAMAVRAPGMLSSHYAPEARVVLVEHPAGLSTASADPGWLLEAAASAGEARIGLLAQQPLPTPPGWVRVGAPEDPEQYARQLYAALRAADSTGVDLLIAVLPDPAAGPLAEAVRDRLSRAAHVG